MNKIKIKDNLLLVFALLLQALGLFIMLMCAYGMWMNKSYLLAAFAFGMFIYFLFFADSRIFK